MSAYIRGNRAIVTDQKGARLKPAGGDPLTAVEVVGDAWEPLDCPVRVALWFAMPRPSSAPKRRRTWPMRHPDLDKLVRAALDAITQAGVIKDDARVVGLHAIKDWPSTSSR